jgi:hypothetical protein
VVAPIIQEEPEESLVVAEPVVSEAPEESAASVQEAVAPKPEEPAGADSALEEEMEDRIPVTMEPVGVVPV